MKTHPVWRCTAKEEEGSCLRTYSTLPFSPESLSVAYTWSVWGVREFWGVLGGFGGVWGVLGGFGGFWGVLEGFGGLGVFIKI